MNSCELCASTWGNYWKIIEGKNLFFCCDICAIQYENLINRIRESAGMNNFKIVEIDGSSRDRLCIVEQNNKIYRFNITFGPSGRIINFRMN